MGAGPSAFGTRTAGPGTVVSAAPGPRCSWTVTAPRFDGGRGPQVQAICQLGCGVSGGSDRPTRYPATAVVAAPRHPGGLTPRLQPEPVARLEHQDVRRPGIEQRREVPLEREVAHRRGVGAPVLPGQIDRRARTILPAQYDRPAQ